MIASEVPGLRDAYAAETAAVQRIADMKERLRRAGLDVLRLGRDRDALAGRAARGEPVTGADLRTANEAIADAEATITLLTDALRPAGACAYNAAAIRQSAENEASRAANRPFLEALDVAKAALATAQAAHDKAAADAHQLPPAARGDLERLLDAHGRDLAAAATVQEMRRIDQVNESRKMMGQPPMAWA